MAGPDRALRRMLARLAELPSEDCGAILEGLDERQRARVSALLADIPGWASKASDAGLVASFDAKALPPGLSPWLLERLGVPLEEGPVLAGQEAMTDHAATALRSCAAELDPPPLPPAGGSSLVGVLWRRLAALAGRRVEPA